jgi:hypothetical protein
VWYFLNIFLSSLLSSVTILYVFVQKTWVWSLVLSPDFPLVSNWFNQKMLGRKLYSTIRHVKSFLHVSGAIKTINKHTNVLQPYLPAFPAAVLPLSQQFRKLSFQKLYGPLYWCIIDKYCMQLYTETSYHLHTCSLMYHSYRYWQHVSAKNTWTINRSIINIENKHTGGYSNYKSVFSWNVL